LAAALEESGHSAHIYDYGVVEVLERLVPKELRASAQMLASRALGETPLRSLSTLTAVWQLRGMTRKLRARQHALHLDVARELADAKPDFAVFVVDSPDEYAGTLAVASRLRKLLPSIRMAITGEFVEAYGERLAAGQGIVDALCGMYPEHTLVQWADWLARPEDWPRLPGLTLPAKGRPCFRDQSHIDFDPNCLRTGCYRPDVYPALAEGKLKLFTLETTRSCSSDCTACPHAVQEGLVPRTRSARLMCDDMAHIMRHQHAAVFHFGGVPAPFEQAAAVASEILSRGLSVKYTRNMSVVGANPALFSTLKASGCQGLSFRIDTGSQYLLDEYYRRGFGVSECERILRACRFSDMAAITRFTYPCPVDDYHTRAETVRLIERIRPTAALIDMPDMSSRADWGRLPTEFGFKEDTEAFLRAAADGPASGAAPLVPWSAFASRQSRITAGQALQENDDLVRELEDVPVSTSLTPELFLVARMSGYEGHEQDFGALMRRRLLTGDVGGVAAVVDNFNRRVTARADAGVHAPHMAILKAVGN